MLPESTTTTGLSDDVTTMSDFQIISAEQTIIDGDAVLDGSIVAFVGGEGPETLLSGFPITRERHAEVRARIEAGVADGSDGS